MVMSLRSKWAVGKAVRAGLAVEGAYLNRYVTDEQRSRRPIFNATLRAAAGWLFFRVARSTRMTQIWALYRQSGSDRLEKQPTDLRRHHHYMRDGTLTSRNVSACRRMGVSAYRRDKRALCGHGIPSTEDEHDDEDGDDYKFRNLGLVCEICGICGLLTSDLG